MEYVHFPVLLEDTIQGLNIKEDGIYVDGTLGGAGHSQKILERLNGKGLLIANDLDIAAINNAKEKLKDYKNVKYINDDYKNICKNLDDLKIDKVDGMLFDLGVSSYQIDTPERGFSYTKDAKLDMRMNQHQSLSAYEVINMYSEKELLRVLYEYGEEKNARKIVQKIIDQRKEKKIESTLELAELVANCYPAKFRYGNGNPAKKVFQAIRIEVNGELQGLEEFIKRAIMRLKPNGRLCVITFHSLEDRIVKHAFKALGEDEPYNKHLPLDYEYHKKVAEIITKKPILGEKEVDINKRSESAKLRIIQKI